MSRTVLNALCPFTLEPEYARRQTFPAIDRDDMYLIHRSMACSIASVPSSDIKIVDIHRRDYLVSR